MNTVKKKIAGLFSGIVLIFSLVSCHHSPDISGAPVVSFQNDVLPILGGNCNAPSCHGPFAEHRPLDTYDHVMTTVSAGDIYGSKLFKVITAQSSSSVMPPRPQAPLTNQQIATIEVWILQGAPNN
jgi:hypothetical protein